MRFVATALLSMLAACAIVSPKQYRSSTTLTPVATFDCAQAKLAGLGYTIQDANREAGFVRARETEPSNIRLNGELYYAEVTISVVTDPRSQKTTLNVTATEKAHATAILAACGGEVVGRPTTFRKPRR